jgi:membrane-associated phospholipid phosphatase
LSEAASLGSRARSVRRLMRVRSRLLVAAGLSCASQVLGAQSIGRLFVDDVSHSTGDVAAIWRSPFRASAHDWLLTAGAAGAFSVSMLADRPIAAWAARSEDSPLFDALRPVRQGGAAYSAKFVLPPLLTLYAVGLASRRSDLREAATGCGASWFSQSMMRQATYRLVARQRPDTSLDDPQRWDLPGDGKNWQLQSFPAGHLANAMACASFWSNRYHLGYGEPALYALAAFVGLGRIADGGHWTSDSVLGGIIGYATGREIARRSRVRAERASTPEGARFVVRTRSFQPRVGFAIRF